MTSQLSYWILQVPDVEKAAAFYSAVLSWEFSEPGSAGGRHVLGSDPWGGLSPRAEEAAPASGSLAFKPEDMDAAIAKVRELGGEAVEPEAVNGEDYGRWVECTDDQDTRFVLFEPAT